MSEKAFGDDFYGYEGMSEEEMMQRMKDEDAAAGFLVDIEGENDMLEWGDGHIDLVGIGGSLDRFEPDPDLDAALLAALWGASS